jgi:hypothetical protein
MAKGTGRWDRLGPRLKESRTFWMGELAYMQCHPVNKVGVRRCLRELERWGVVVAPKGKEAVHGK